MALGKGPGLAAKPVPKPSAAVVTEAHNLLSLMGDPKRVKEPLAMLAEMREVQTQNDVVAEAARTLIADADKRIGEAEAAETKIAAERKKLADETQTASNHLSAKRSEIERERRRIDEDMKTLDGKAEDIAMREREIRRVASALKGYMDG